MLFPTHIFCRTQIKVFLKNVSTVFVHTVDKTLDYNGFHYMDQKQTHKNTDKMQNLDKMLI